MSESSAMPQSANMSDLLPTNFVGTAMCAAQNDDGKFRVYFQNKDYQIYEMSLNDPKSTTYTLLKLTNDHMPAARINTPIAAVACNNLQDVGQPCRVSLSHAYYIITDPRLLHHCEQSCAGDLPHAAPWLAERRNHWYCC
jgi:hypothetical protein